MTHYTAEVEFDAERGMYCVTVYRDGHWDSEEWFHTEMAAEYYAERAKLGKLEPEDQHERK